MNFDRTCRRVRYADARLLPDGLLRDASSAPSPVTCYTVLFAHRLWHDAGATGWTEDSEEAD